MFSSLVFKKPCSKLGAALFPTCPSRSGDFLFWIQGSIVSLESCLAGSGVSFLRTEGMSKKAHVSLTLFFYFIFLVLTVEMIFPGQCFLQCRRLSWCRLHNVGRAQTINGQHLRAVSLLSRSARWFICSRTEQLYCPECERCLLLSASDGEGLKSLATSLTRCYPSVISDPCVDSRAQ